MGPERLCDECHLPVSMLEEWQQVVEGGAGVARGHRSCIEAEWGPAPCPRCGHPAAAHPMDAQRHGRICSVGIGEVPSCIDCAAPLLALQEPRAGQTASKGDVDDAR